MPDSSSHVRRLVLFTKPAVPGRVKTRLVGTGPGALSAPEAAALHQAFLDDVAGRLLAAEKRGELELWTAWALVDGEEVPAGPGRSLRQEGDSLGDRLHHGLSVAADETGAAVSVGETGAAVAALGSDHPTVTAATVREAFERIEAGADVVLGPSDDGGYFLIALAPGAVRRALFDGIAWSTDAVLAQTIERAEALGLAIERLPNGFDVDTPDDLRRLAGQLLELGPDAATALCPRTWALLDAWGRLDRPGGARVGNGALAEVAR